MGAPPFKDRQCDYNATIVERLNAAGAVVSAGMAPWAAFVFSRVLAQVSLLLLVVASLAIP